METEVSTQIGAGPYERSSERVAYRNGYRTRRWDTRVGTIELKIPKVTAGAYFPSLLEPRRRAEKALHAVVVVAYVKGVSTRKVDDLVRALGIDGIYRSEVSRICKVLDEEVRAFLSRPIEEPCPYVWLDATFHKVREARAGGLGGDRRRDRGHRAGRALGARRGDRGERRTRSPRSCARSSLNPTTPRRWTSCTRLPGCSHRSSLRVAELLEDAAEDVLAHLHFPREHRRRLHSTTRSSGCTRIKRRTRVVGIFPTRDPR